ncbi:hypothetical protein DF3PB_2050005 [uncultured Defluviicoccus sp.]|uniref:Uncharacterized protein n=1 Tax=metagenome TaxID=256318 RepID=A0A380TBA5_9ZZZZ|nr:hypothetical protein DF3PB_2050005 [uncultured Defluviicoccus sp.]
MPHHRYEPKILRSVPKQVEKNCIVALLGCLYHRIGQLLLPHSESHAPIQSLWSVKRALRRRRTPETGDRPT